MTSDASERSNKRSWRSSDGKSLLRHEPVTSRNSVAIVDDPVSDHDMRGLVDFDAAFLISQMVVG
jgi:hypothetical protein